MHFFEVLGEFWSYVITLILPQNIEVNCPKFNGSDTPSAAEFFAHMQPLQVVFLAIGTPLTMLIIGLATFQYYYVLTLISSEERRNNLYFLISLFPVSAICCLIGMILPRTAILLSSFGLLYFLMCLFILVSLIRHLAQGRDQLARMLTQRQRLINFQSPPFCCFLWCLPRAQPTERNLRRLESIVLQAPIVRVVILFGQVIAVAELRERAQSWLHLFDLASLISLLLAIFGIHTLARVVSDQLSQYGFMGIFRMVDFALLFYSAQQPILFQNILLRFNIIQCGPVLSPQDNARFMCSFVIICEMFLLSVCSLFLVNPKRNNLFDKYHGAFGALSTCAEVVDATVSAANPPSGVYCHIHRHQRGTVATASICSVGTVREEDSGCIAASSSSGATAVIENGSVCTQMTLLSSDNMD